MATVTMSLRTDKKLKEQASALAKKMGMPLSTLINGFLHQFVRDKEVHFRMEPPYKLRKEVAKELDEIDEDIKAGRNLSPKFNSVEEMLDYLHNAKI